MESRSLSTLVSQSELASQFESESRSALASQCESALRFESEPELASSCWWESRSASALGLGWRWASPWESATAADPRPRHPQERPSANVTPSPCRFADSQV